MAANPLKGFERDLKSIGAASSTSEPSPAAKVPYAEAIGKKVPEGVTPSQPEAVAAAMAFGGGVVGRYARYKLRDMMATKAREGAIKTPRGFLTVTKAGELGLAPAPPVKSIAELHTKILTDTAEAPRAKLLGLFDLQQRSTPLSKPFVESNKKFVSQAAAGLAGTEELEKIQKTVDSFIDKHKLADKGVTLSFRRGPMSTLHGPGYQVGSKTVVLPRMGRDVILHELGHAADYTGSRLGKIRAYANPLIRNTVRWAVPAAIVAGDQIKKILPGTVDDRAIEFMQEYAPHITAATIAATTLHPEAKASLLAIRHVAQTEGKDAARVAAKRLGGSFGTYLLGAIPAIVGISLAKSWMKQKGEQDKPAVSKEDLQKTAGIVSSIGGYARKKGREVMTGLDELRESIPEALADIKHVGSQVGRQSADIIKDRRVLGSLGQAAKNVGADPEFAIQSLGAGLPAAMASLYFYGTPSGKIIRSRMEDRELKKTVPLGSKGKLPLLSKADESWRERNPLQFAGMVGLGAGLASGVLARMIRDLTKVA